MYQVLHEVSTPSMPQDDVSTSRERCHDEAGLEITTKLCVMYQLHTCPETTNQLPVNAVKRRRLLDMTSLNIPSLRDLDSRVHAPTRRIDVPRWLSRRGGTSIQVCRDLGLNYAVSASIDSNVHAPTRCIEFRRHEQPRPTTLAIVRSCSIGQGTRHHVKTTRRSKG
ncbi:hypothetical protein B0H34DRAFT_739350 [Crassisporium funariophilum]|nr:hypothetical protein B0H34DRAFT_739350 [Crassisporium funariophilum]